MQRWCVLGIVGLVSGSIALPGWAQATLQSWRYDPQWQRLQFQTDQPTQPQVQVVQQQRLVIDLPATRWPYPQNEQSFGTATVRVAQYQPDVTRLVVALPHVISTDQVQLQSQGNGWIVAWSAPPAVRTVLLAAQRQGRGILLRLSGPTVVGRVTRSHDRQWLYVDLPNTAVSVGFQDQTRPYNLRVETGNSGHVRLVLEVSSNDPDWQLFATPQGLLLQPPPKPAPAPVTSRPSRTTSPAPPLPRPRYVVFLDPGHGGSDPGAIGRGGIREKDIVLDISRRVARLLNAQGIRTVVSRHRDVDLDLAPRVALAERVNATVFVSIHANALHLSRPEVNGVETYYYQTGRWLARSIHKNVLKTTRASDRGVRRARFYVLRRSSMRATLVEVGYVTGAEDAPRLASAAYRQKVAEGIAQGIIRYLDNLARQ
ncbi:MAG: N-acetylmuramoyl-L-alanine amidase [Gloeomargarita sp. SKYG116]|nr:N-acetylmuramoyl-L-alanine amidase [Gloeomargarita sp. SKYG116]MCS7225661.1 N-acetylmuramoyl-L-alanine amidase [Gloeomargarita sp. SKYB31]MDW8402003.1 N-acetylmuramoyl-L-alanine amidase [Gloeomargarita sp. SKYGB_i_bin116]